MPIVVITGLPASGKSTRAQELCDYFKTKMHKNVRVISENEAVPYSLFTKNAHFSNPDMEKTVRSNLISDASRFIEKDNVIILDAGNYIKGYRYELFCAMKASRTTQCTLFCCIAKDQAWTFNTQRHAEDTLESTENNSTVPYTRDVFDALCMRYEEPQSTNRWDSPLIVALPEDKLDVDAIYKALFEATPCKPNQSTQNPPLAATNYLFDVDKILQDVINEILGAVRIGRYGPLRIKGCPPTTTLKVKPSMMSPQLNRLRQKFITSKCRVTQTKPAPLDLVPVLFVLFINANYGT